MATQTVASAIPFSHPQTTASPDDSFPSRENTLPQKIDSSTESALPRGKATNGLGTCPKAVAGGTGTGSRYKSRHQSVHGPGAIAYARSAAAAGMACKAIARGHGATAAASGTFSHAIIRRGGEAEAAGAVGSRCLSESFNGHAFVTATGMLCHSVSHRAACPAVSVGFNPVSHAADTRGIAVTVGEYGTASAGPGGYLVFVDTNAVGGPAAQVFAVGEHGIEPNVAYCWSAGMTRPKRIDLKKYPELDWAAHKRFMRGMDHERESQSS